MSNNPNRLKFITFGSLSLKSTYPFLAAIFYIGKNYTYYGIKETDVEKRWYNNPFFFNVLFFFGSSLNGIFYLISLKMNLKTPKKRFVMEHIETIARFTLVSSKKKTLTILFHFFLVGFLSVIIVCVINIMSSLYDTSDLQYETRIFNLFFVSVLSYFILKYQITRHHLFSIACVAIGIILCFFSKFIYEDVKDIQHIFIHLANYVIFSIRDVFTKWILENEHQTSLRLVYYQGLFALIIQLGAFFIYNEIYPMSTLPFGTLVSNMFVNVSLSFWFIGHILSSIFYSLFCIYTIFHFTPTALTIAFSFAMIPWKIIFINTIESTSQKILVITGYVLVLIGCLIYNEIIIIHVCKLENDTRVEIDKRGIMELKEDTSRCLSEEQKSDTEKEKVLYDKDEEEEEEQCIEEEGVRNIYYD